MKMLVVDLDGTALWGHDRIRPEDLAAAERLREAGVHVTIATGRLVGGTQWVADALGVRGSYAVMNGSARIGGSAHSSAFTPAALTQIGSTMRTAGLVPFQFDEVGVQHAADARDHHPYLSVWSPDVQVVDLDWSREDVLAVGAIGAQDAIDEVSFAGHEVVRFKTFGGDPFVHVRLPDHDKGTALQAMAEERGLTAQDVVAVGDWWNDVPMLRAAGRSFAMGNAGSGALEAADQVLDAERGQGGAIAEIAARVWGL